jgi:hypothetical protein
VVAASVSAVALVASWVVWVMSTTMTSIVIGSDHL